MGIETDIFLQRIAGAGGGGGGAVSSVNGQTGAVELTAGDVGAATEQYVDGAINSIPAPSWGDVDGKPSSYPPSAHGHGIGEVSGLQGELDSKASASSVASKVGSPNSSVTGVAFYATIGDLPTPGDSGVLYFVGSAE